MGKIIKIGVWENCIFKGCVTFSRGANNNIGAPYGLKQTEVCELTRVALNKHDNPVSRVLRIAIKLLKHSNPDLKLIVSYADDLQGHIGSIYQAGNWVYTGDTEPQYKFLFKGEWRHPRSIDAVRGNHSGLPKQEAGFKRKYLYPLTSELKTQIEPLRKPYPKRV